MSKSLHNIVYPEDLIDQGFSWEQIRFYLLSVHYRKKLNLSIDEIRKTSSRLNAVREMVADLLLGAQPGEDIKEEVAGGLAGELNTAFEKGMDNDLDTPSVIAKVFETIERLHSLHKAGRIGVEQGLSIGAQLLRIDSVLQVLV
jgi:cysteinyl-tRNA synthetase